MKGGRQEGGNGYIHVCENDNEGRHTVCVK